MSTKILRSGAFIYTVGVTDAGTIASIAFIDPTQPGVTLSLSYDEQGAPQTLSQKTETPLGDERQQTQYLIFQMGANAAPLTVTTQTLIDPDPAVATPSEPFASPLEPRTPDAGEASHAAKLLERFENIHSWASARI